MRDVLRRFVVAELAHLAKQRREAVASAAGESMISKRKSA
jgi:hypothetical protein